MKILKSLDPEYLIHRTATDQIVGVLADRDLDPLVGDSMMLTDGEVDPGAEPQAYAVVKLRKGVRFASGEAAVQKLGEKLDPFMAQTFGESAEPVWFHPLAAVDAWEESHVVKGLEVPVRIQKIAATDPDEAAVRDLSAEDLGVVARLLDSRSAVEGAEELAVIVKAEYGRRGLEVDEELEIFKGIKKAVWSTKYINDLKDENFLYIAPGGEKDEEGKTVPRTLRNFPVRDENGKLDLPHLRNAIARIPQSNAEGLDAAKKKSLQDKARKLLEEQKKNS
jgi:hypothetical protein